MPEDKTPQESTPTDTPAENTSAFAWPTTETTTDSTPEVVTSGTSVVTDGSDVEAPADGAVSAAELAAFSQAPTVPSEAASPIEATTPSSTPVSPFGATAAPIIAGSVASGSGAPQKSPKKKLIVIGAIIIGALGLLGGGFAAAYNLWYQNPDKVVLEAVSSLLEQGTSTHKISVDVKSKDTTVKVTVNAKLGESPATEADVAATIGYNGKDYKVTGSTISDKDGNLYLKVNDVKDLLTQFAGDEADFSAFDNVIKKIDGNWIKISSDDLKSVSEDYSKTQACTTDALKSFDDKAVSDEVLAVYKKNDFIVVGDKIGVRTIDGVASLGYKVTFDEAKAKTFYTALGETKVGKALTKCDSSFDFKNSTDTNSDKDKVTGSSEIQVWSSRFGHKLTELNISGKNDDTTATIVWNPKFVKGVTVAAPEKSVPISEVIQDVEDDYTKMYSSYYSSDYSSGLSSSQTAFKLTSLL